MARRVSFYGPGQQITPAQQDYRTDPRRRLEETLLANGTSTAPVQSAGEGIARALQAGIGGYFQGQARNELKEREAKYSAGMQKALQAAQPQYTQLPAGVQGPPNQISPGGTQGIIQALQSSDNPDLVPFLQQMQLQQVQEQNDAKTREDEERAARARYLFEQNNKAPTLPPSVKEYKFAQDNGYQGTFEQWNAANGGGQETYSNAPIWTKDQNGNHVLVQVSNRGNSKPVDLPGELTPQRGGSKTVDLGDRVAVMDANGHFVGYQPKGLAPNETPETKNLQAGAAASGKQAVEASGKAFDGLAKVGTSLANIDEAIAAIDAGAETGPVYKMLPSVTAASVELDNIRNRMGLDVISAVTFGALSKGEQDLALDTALPTGLEPPQLREWLVRKKTAQQKLSKYLSEAAVYLGKPGNTVASWTEMQAMENQGNNSIVPAAGDNGIVSPDTSERDRLRSKYRLELPAQ